MLPPGSRGYDFLLRQDANQFDAPKGVRGRSSDNTLIKGQLAWEPSIPLQIGLEKTHAWIFDQMKSGRSSKRTVNQF
jgi:hypothetical protein